MPATSLFSVKLRQLATDSTPFYFMTAVVQVVFFFIYWIGIVAFARPQTCDPGTDSAPQQWVITFLLLVLFLTQAALTVAATLCTFKGTPLEPSKRHGVTRLSYAYLGSLPINVGLLAYSAWVVQAGDGSCWSSGNKSMPATIVFGAVGVLVGQLTGWLVTYNSLSDVEAGSVWQALTRTGASSLVHLIGSYKEEHRGPPAALEEMATQLQRLMTSIDGEKTDAAAGLVCAKLLQDEAAAAARPAQQPVQGYGEPPVTVPIAAGSTKAAVDSKSKDSGLLRSAELLSWAEEVCRGAAAACPAAAGDLATEGDMQEALHWARFAASVYGARQHMWRRGERGSCATKQQLARLAAAARAEGARPLVGWGGLAATSCDSSRRRANAPSKAELTDFAAARELLGPGCQIVSFSSGDKKRGLLPNMLALDTEKQTVVLSIAGNWQRPPPAPKVQPLPPEWLIGADVAAAAAEAGAEASRGVLALDGSTACNGTGSGKRENGSSNDWVHSDSLKAAEALLGELERSQLLQQLLQRGNNIATGALQGLDCIGWQLVLSGHGLGAGAASLLALRLLDWQLAPATVWVYAPPGELCSGRLAATLASRCSLTAVVVGNDLSPRGSSAALQTLVEQSLVGLARLRFCKTGLLAALIGEALGPRRWRRRWVNPARALRPLSQVPEEALAYLQRYRDWQFQQQQEQDERQPAAFPGRVLLLSRRPSGEAVMAAPSGDASSSSNSSSSRSANGSATQQHWRAGWVSGAEVAGWGIRVSRHATSDHYVSRLLGVLGDLVIPAQGLTADV